MRGSLRLVLAAVSGGLVLLACGQPASPPTEPATTTSAPAPIDSSTSSPAPTASPEPSPLPTEPSLQLEVLEWHRWDEPVEAWDVDRGWGRVYALVRNPHEFPVQAVGTPRFRLLDGAGQPVYRSLGVGLFDGSVMGIGQILPGETIGLSFCACGSVGTVVIPEWTVFELEVDLAPAPAVPLSTDFQLTPGRVFQNEYPMEGTFAVAFTGRYTGSQPLKAVAVRMTVRDRQGTYLGSGEVGILGDRVPGGFADIQPGDSFDQTVSILLDPAFVSAALDYQLFAVGAVAGP